MTLDAAKGVSSASAPLSAEARIMASGLFDADYYLAQRPRLPRDISVLIEDYLEVGWREGADPSAQFSTRYYLTINDDVRANGCNPLLHYIDQRQGRGAASRPTSGAGRRSGRAGPDGALGRPSGKR